MDISISPSANRGSNIEQFEVHIAIIQYAEVTGEMVWWSRDRL